VLSHPLARWVPLWPAPPPKGEIRASFDREVIATGKAPGERLAVS